MTGNLATLGQSVPPTAVDRQKAARPAAVFPKGLMQDTLSPERLGRHGLFEPRVVERLMREHVAKDADHSFQLWYDRFIEGVPTPDHAPV